MPETEKAESSTALEGKEEPEAKGTQDPDGEEHAENVPWNKDPRFKDFIGKRKLLKEYEGLGSPGEIAGYVQQLESRVSAMENERKPKEPKTTEQQEHEANLAKARKQLREIDPDLESLGSLKASVEAQNRSLEVRALDETAKVMKDAGLSAGKGEITGMTNILAEIIGSDEVLLAEYMGNPREAVRLAWKKLGAIAKSAGVDRSEVAAAQREKEKQTKLPKPQSASGSTGIPKVETTSRGLKKIGEQAKAYLKGLD